MATLNERWNERRDRELESSSNYTIVRQPRAKDLPKRLCYSCSRTFTIGGRSRSTAINIADPDGYFCRLRCAANWAVTALKRTKHTPIGPKA